MRRVVLAFTLAGCQAFFPLEEGTNTCPLPPDPQCTTADPDEDGDNVRDDCDPCPQSSQNTDTDGDGIGDACDPVPDVKAKCLSRRFFGMTGPIGWFDTTGWSFQDDAFTEDPSLSSGILVALQSIDRFGTGRLEGVIDAGETEGTRESAIIGYSAMVGDGDGYFCGITLATGTGAPMIARLAGNKEQVLVVGTEDNLGYTPGTHHRVRFTIAAGGKLSCEVNTNNNPAQTIMFTDPMPLVGGTVGVVERSNAASFRYLDFVPD